MIFSKRSNHETTLPFKKIHKALLKKIRAEVSKINFQEKAILLPNLRLRLDKITLEFGTPPLMIQQRLKSPQAITEKVVRKIERFFCAQSEKSLTTFMQKLHLDTIKDNIFDMLGFRMVFSEKKECYRYLEYLNQHPKFKMIKSETVDYIRNPKKNGYQAIHVILQDQKSAEYFEIQILTFDMYLNSGLGAAGWDAYQQHRKQSFIRNIWRVFLNFTTPKGGFFEPHSREISNIEE